MLVPHGSAADRGPCGKILIVSSLSFTYSAATPMCGFDAVIYLQLAAVSAPYFMYFVGQKTKGAAGIGSKTGTLKIVPGPCGLDLGWRLAFWGCKLNGTWSTEGGRISHLGRSNMYVAIKNTSWLPRLKKSPPTYTCIYCGYVVYVVWIMNFL